MEPYDRAAEVHALLEADQTRLGEVFRWSQQGLSSEQQAERAGGVIASNYGYNLSVIIRALAEGFVPNGPSLASHAASRARAWLKEKELSPELRADLEATAAQLAMRADDRTAQAKEEADATAMSKKVAAERVPGIYVYTLPHYWRHKVDPDNDQTYLKVGKSDTDVFLRVDQQRTTALPEDPWLLRVYPTVNSAELERKFHAMLDAADHHRAVSKKGGREWFLTSLRILDWYASDQGLEVRRPNESTVGDE